MARFFSILWMISCALAVEMVEKNHLLFFVLIQRVINYLILLNTWRFAQFAQLYFLFDNSISYYFFIIFCHGGLILQSFSAILGTETDRSSPRC